MFIAQLTKIEVIVNPRVSHPGHYQMAVAIAILVFVLVMDVRSPKNRHVHILIAAVGGSAVNCGIRFLRHKPIFVYAHASEFEIAPLGSIFCAFVNPLKIQWTPRQWLTASWTCLAYATQGPRVTPRSRRSDRSARSFFCSRPRRETSPSGPGPQGRSERSVRVTPGSEIRT